MTSAPTRDEPLNGATTGPPDRLLRVLLGWTAVTTLPFWLILVRGAFDGPSYRWGLFGFSGMGMTGDYWMPAVGVAGAAATLTLGWRGARLPFHWLLLAWHVLLTGLLAYGAVAYGDRFRLQGDTLGFSVPLGAAGVALFGGITAVVVYWVYRDLRSRASRDAPRWAAANRRWAWGLAGMLPLQFLLLRSGPPDGVSDQIGTVITVGQWLLLGQALKVRDEPASARPGSRGRSL